jgi:two-component system nitrate/nitrite sensor histidine kinase NarX
MVDKPVNHNDSIIFRSGLTMAGIVLLALLSMISSVFIAESSKGDAAAINLAGSLRMQSYRIATRLQSADTETGRAGEVTHEISEFERRLNYLWGTGAISVAANNPRHQTLRAIELFWRENLRPILQTSTLDRTPPTPYLRQVDDFVAKLDGFVKLLEQDSEAKILLLRLVQGIALFMTLVLIFVAMHQLHSGVVTPLRDLVELADKARSGDLSVRASHVGDDELGVLGHAFNLMAADLSAMYADLEARVEQQTQALRISNRSLELLYNTARRLGGATPDAAMYQTLLADIERLIGISSVHLCLIHPVTHQATEMFSAPSGSSAAGLPFCGRPHCEPCLGDGATHPLDRDREIFSVPIKDQERQFGVLIVRNPGLESAVGWQLPLLEAVALNIAAALRAGEQSEHRRRVALLEERNAIARELHDSLAQSLSYLKIQVGRLYMAVNGPNTSIEVRDIVAELREGLNGAYRQLRELITTFRLKMEHPRLEDSLHEMAREFSRRSGLPINLDQSGWTCTLNPNEQIHVMQIVREALHNAVKHARASQVSVRLRSLDDSEAVVEIMDNGVGLPAQPERDQHFGLNIMRERAAHVGGILSLDSPPDQGVRVRLSFRPVACRNSLTPQVEALHA